MAFFDDTINVLQAAITLIGLGTVIVGGIFFGQSYTSDDATKRQIGINTVIGGIIVAVMGIILVPKLKDYIPSVAAIQTGAFMTIQQIRSIL